MINYDIILKPHEEEKYQSYIQRLSLIRNFGKNNRPDHYYTEGHHIIPRCNGGQGNKENMIILLPEEHYYCHKLLALENPHNSKLQFAWWSMCHQADSDVKRKYKISSEEYAEAKRRIAKETQIMNSIPVVEFISGVIYTSAEEAAKKLNIKEATNITTCCKKRAKSANGYKFCYLSDYVSGNYENKTIGNKKRIIDLDTFKIYESSVEVKEELNLSMVHVWEVCRGERKSAGGHRFAYYEDYLNGNYTKKEVGHIGKKVQDIDSKIIYNSIAEAGEKLNLDPSAISKVCKNKISSTKGYKFIFYLENSNEMDNQQPIL